MAQAFEDRLHLISRQRAHQEFGSTLPQTGENKSGVIARQQRHDLQVAVEVGQLADRSQRLFLCTYYPHQPGITMAGAW
jgi:hypothetical protein